MVDPPCCARPVVSCWPVARPRNEIYSPTTAFGGLALPRDLISGKRRDGGADDAKTGAYRGGPRGRNAVAEGAAARDCRRRAESRAPLREGRGRPQGRRAGPESDRSGRQAGPSARAAQAGGATAGTEERAGNRSLGGGQETLPRRRP